MIKIQNPTIISNESPPKKKNWLWPIKSTKKLVDLDLSSIKKRSAQIPIQGPRRPSIPSHRRRQWSLPRQQEIHPKSAYITFLNCWVGGAANDNFLNYPDFFLSFIPSVIQATCLIPKRWRGTNRIGSIFIPKHAMTHDVIKARCVVWALTQTQPHLWLMKSMKFIQNRKRNDKGWTYIEREKTAKSLVLDVMSLTSPCWSALDLPPHHPAHVSLELRSWCAKWFS